MNKKITKINKELFLDAFNPDFKDFEDALQNFSAIEEGKRTVLLTRNIKNFKKDDFAVMSLKTYSNFIRKNQLNSLQY